MKEIELGYVSNYFSRISVAAVEMTAGTLSINDVIHIKGHKTDLEIKVDSLQIDHEPVTEVKQGDSIGLKVPEKVKRKDKVYKNME